MDIKEVVEKVVSLVKDGKLDVSALKSADLSSLTSTLSGLGVDLGDLDVSKVVEMAKSALGSVDGVVDAARDAAEGAVDAAKDAAEDAVDTAKDAAEGAAEDAAEEGKGILSKIGEALGLK